MNARYSGSAVALIVNSHHAARRALRERISASFANVQLWEAATISDALALLDEIHIDIVMIDGEANGISGLQGTRAVLARSPTVSVIVMSPFSEPMCRFAANKAGAMAFVSKRAINSELMQILADLVNRGNVVPRINSAQ
jgi:two-component system invasion response regulator UvrY